MLLWHARNMAEPSIITPEEYHDIFGSSDEENGNVDAEGSDIDVQEVESDADAIGKETVWSNELANFVISPFNGQPGIKGKFPEEPRSDFFFNLIFGDEMIDLIIRETYRYARQKPI